MAIHIEALTFDVIIGLLDFERERPQRVIIDLEASYEYNDKQFINYADMVLLIQKELKEKNKELQLLQKQNQDMVSKMDKLYSQLELLQKEKSDLKYWIRMRAVIDQYELPIKTWMIGD